MRIIKYVSLILIVCMLLSSNFVVNAAEYRPGPITTDISFAEPISIDGGNTSGNSLLLNPGGEATFDLLLRENAVSGKVYYSSLDNAVLTLNSGDICYSVELLKEEKEKELLEDVNVFELKAEDFENCYTVDYILDGSEYNDELLGTLAAHPEYFGNHIDEPTIIVKNIPLMSIMAVGTNKDSMKISYNGIDYVKFKDTDFVEEITNNRAKKLTVYGRPNLNEWMGKQSVQVFITDYELVEDNSKYDF